MRERASGAEGVDNASSEREGVKKKGERKEIKKIKVNVSERKKFTEAICSPNYLAPRQVAVVVRRKKKWTKNNRGLNSRIHKIRKRIAKGVERALKEEERARERESNLEHSQYLRGGQWRVRAEWMRSFSGDRHRNEFRREGSVAV